jgi:DNA-binding transcriptional ArsR family regulator
LTAERTACLPSVLKKAGLVADRRVAQWVYYRRNPALSKKVKILIDAALALKTNERK